MKLIIASGNKNKIKEIKGLLSPYFKEIISAAEAGFNQDVKENDDTFYKNALLKAQTVSKALNCAALADDSGLCVDALDGKPGVHSARYSGEHGNDKANNIKLLKDMENQKNRKCKFVCSVVICFPDGKPISGEGNCEGELLCDFDGDGGFGYDSIFYSTELCKSFGRATEKEKNSISHRSKALADLLKKL